MGVIDSKHRKATFFNITVCATLVALTLIATPARAATITVLDMNDAISHSVMCTLRDAISAINNGADNGCTAVGAYGIADTINVPVGTYTLMPNFQAPEDANWSGDLDILKAVTITGAGAASTTIDGNGATTGDRVFDIDPAATGIVVEISNVSISGGQLVSTSGAGIRNNTGTTLTIRNSSILGNTAGNRAGGVGNWGVSLTVVNSTISNNSASGDGGGIYSVSAVTLNSSTVSGNNSAVDGGGVYSWGALSMSNSVVTGNTAANWGGGIWANNGLTLDGSTIDTNSASTWGGGIFARGTSNITNSAVFGNSATGTGGGISTQGQVTITSSTVTGNTAPNAAGVNSTSAVTLASSSVDNNIATNGIGGIKAMGPTGIDQLYSFR